MKSSEKFSKKHEIRRFTGSSWGTDREHCPKVVLNIFDVNCPRDIVTHYCTRGNFFLVTLSFLVWMGLCLLTPEHSKNVEEK